MKSKLARRWLITTTVALLCLLAGLILCGVFRSTSISTSGVATYSNKSASIHSRKVPNVATVHNHIQASIRANEVPVRGVNLGSWLVTEHWMTEASDFWIGVADKNTGEFDLMSHCPNTSYTRECLSHHHMTFIKERDIEDMAQHGINTVRVPVGWWIPGYDNWDSSRYDWKVYPSDTLKYLDLLVTDWSVKYNIAVLISIHAAKGSQNGADHSAPFIIGQALWSTYPENVLNTIELVRFLADRYINSSSFLGIGLLNEPGGTTNETILNQYYHDAYQAIRASGNECILSIMPMLHKQTADNLVGFMEAPTYTNVWIEWHPYFIWGFETHTAEQLIHNDLQEYSTKVTAWTQRPNANKLFFGEWSLSNNGQFTDPETDSYILWTRAQTELMAMATGGWTYWSWRVDGDDQYNSWSMRSVLKRDNLRRILIGNRTVF